MCFSNRRLEVAGPGLTWSSMGYRVPGFSYFLALPLRQKCSASRITSTKSSLASKGEGYHFLCSYHFPYAIIQNLLRSIPLGSVVFAPGSPMPRHGLGFYYYRKRENEYWGASGGLCHTQARVGEGRA